MIMATGTIEMQDMRYLNLFAKITKIPTRHCFMYNEIMYFLVPKQMINKALGKEASNLRKLSSILGKRVRVVPIPLGDQHIKEFIQAIVNPVEFNELEVTDKEVILTAGRQSKAALIGRNKRRLNEMQKIIKNFFGKEFKIV